MMRALGYKPDPPDERDHKLSFAAPKRTPPAANCGHLILGTLDQSTLGSCVLNSIAQSVRCAHVRAGIIDPKLLSRLLAYYAARAATGDTAEDTGTEVRTALKQLGKVGFCPEDDYPYNVDKFAEAPHSDVWREAYDQSVAAAGVKFHFARIDATGAALVQALRQAIAVGLPVSFGCDVDVQFTEDVGTRSIVQPPRVGALAGGHAQLLVGYRTEPDGSTSFCVLNSWGEDFGVEAHGMKGCSWWSEDYITWDGLRVHGRDAMPPSDFWIIDSAPYYSSEAA